MNHREYVQSKIGELLVLIGDAGLREKILDAFVLALDEGGWEKPEDREALPFTLLTDCRGVSFWEHTVAVTRGAIGLANAQLNTYSAPPYPIDMDRLIAGGLLHDVGKLLEFQRSADGHFEKSHSGRCTRHPISGTVIAARAGLPLEIQNIIACHAKEGEGRPQVIETVLIRHADFATFDPLVMLNGGQLIAGAE